MTGIRLRNIRRIGALALFMASALNAQDNRTRSIPSSPTGETLLAGADRKFTPHQKLGLRLLSLAESEAAGAQPDIQAFVLWQASHGYRQIDPARADSLLKHAFQVTFSIAKATDRCMSPAEFCGPKYWLQKEILQDMIAQSKEIRQIEPLLASAEPEVRMIVGQNLFHRYIKEKNFERARYLLYQMAEENEYFCYGCAADLMEAIPRNESHEKLAIFSQAFRGYREHPKEKYPSLDDFAMLILRSWKDLPPSVVVEASDEVMDRAKEADKEQQNARVGISANKGRVDFASVYQFRLYQLIPVLQQLDKPRAESLLRENRELQGTFERYPEGLASMNALPNPDSRPKGDLPRILSIGSTDATQSDLEDVRRDIARRQQLVLSEAKTDPKQALSDAMSLPLDLGPESDFSPRIYALTSLARIAASKDPAVSVAAVGSIRKTAENMPIGRQAATLADLPEIYLELGEEPEARDALKKLGKIAADLYNHDSDLDDPNQAFKGMWPSANLWRRCIAVAAKLSPNLSEEMIQDIPDPDLRAFETITLANSLLGVNVASLSIIEKHKNGVRASMAD